MSQELRSDPGAGSEQGKQTVWNLLRLVATLYGIGILAQAILASFGLFDARPGWIDIHQMLGITLFAVALIQAVLAGLASQRGLVPKSVLMMSLVLVVLTVAQLGLGFSTRESSVAIAWHISLGVGIMALTIANEMTISFAPRLVRS